MGGVDLLKVDMERLCGAKAVPASSYPETSRHNIVNSPVVNCTFRPFGTTSVTRLLTLQCPNFHLDPLGG